MKSLKKLYTQLLPPVNCRKCKDTGKRIKYIGTPDILLGGYFHETILVYCDCPEGQALKKKEKNE